MNKILNCITIGDPEGIGLELIFKIWKNHRNKTKSFFILGDFELIKKKFLNYNYTFKIKKIKKTKEVEKIFNNYLPILDL